MTPLTAGRLSLTDHLVAYLLPTLVSTSFLKNGFPVVQGSKFRREGCLVLMQAGPSKKPGTHSPAIVHAAFSIQSRSTVAPPNFSIPESPVSKPAPGRIS